MGLKPVAARWFEALARADDVSRLAEALARSGVVQVEAEETATVPAHCEQLADVFEELERLMQRYEPHWTGANIESPASAGAPDEVARAALKRIQAWCADADPIITELERALHELSDLRLLSELIASGADELPDLAKLSRAGPTLRVRVYVMPRPGKRRIELPARAWLIRVDGPEHTFVMSVDDGQPAPSLQSFLAKTKARPLELPEQLLQGEESPGRAVDGRIAALEAEVADKRHALAECHQRHELPAALADLERLRWFSCKVPRLLSTRHFVVVTGWTNDPTGEQIQRAIDASGIPALIRFPTAPANRTPPVVLSNARFIQPFETFPGLLGTPSQDEPDPSWPLAIIVPLLFGFMFGDVGQGLVLIGAGLLLRKRLPVLGLLIPGGIAAVFFGLLFGAVFTREDILPALWVVPLEAPLDLLAASVAGGAVIILVGLLLGAVRAHFIHAIVRWLATDAALIAIYIGLLLMVFEPRAGLVAVLGTIWHVVGSAALAERARLSAAFAALGELVEKMLQLLVNTVSFARVGAFALAHAGLSSAVFALSSTASHPVSVALVLIVGNIFMIVLEGLLVSIQTTRLVLFEFFVRFLRGEGRAFRPLEPPLARPPSSPPIQRGVQP